MPKVRSRLKRHSPRHFIRQWRTHRGYTLEQVAEMIGVTHGGLSQLERGVINYTQPMLEKLAEALNCEPADLIMRDPSSDTWSIWDQVKNLPEEEQRRVSAVIDAMRKTG